MKRFLLILAFMSAFISAKAQNEVAYETDTLTMEKLLEDYAILNQQVDMFRMTETKSLILGYSGAALSIATAFVVVREPQMENLALVTGLAAGGCFIASAIYQYLGYKHLKRDRFMITPNGVIIKLKLHE